VRNPAFVASSRRLCASGAAWLLTASIAQGQAGQRCDFVFDNTPATRVTALRLSSGAFHTFIGAGVVAHCAGQNNQLVADSAEFYEDRGVLYLIGNVRYTEPRARVTSNFMTYYQGQERLNAEGNVVATFTNGSVMRGPVADYYRAAEFRQVEYIVATGRPQLTLVERDTSGIAREPVTVNADRIRMDGDSLAYAGGRVEMLRTDVTAQGDSAFMDAGREFMRLMRGPRVTGRGDRPFTLEGEVIDMFARQRELERVVASPGGHATSEDLELFADTIDLRTTEERLSRAFAFGPSRARAVSTERDVLADSLDVLMPNQRLEEVRAVGNAFATSLPDTARVISPERDWLQGDTIVVEFETEGVAEGRTQARQLTATLNARSFHQMQGQNAARDQPTVNYVRGESIVVLLEEGEVSVVVVEGDASGIYMEHESGATPTPGQPGEAAPSVAVPRPPTRETPPRSVPPRPPVRR
jgi:lipopolysaccharide export system protein LptA